MPGLFNVRNFIYRHSLQLLRAVESDNIESVNVALGHRINNKYKNNQGETALHIAAKNGNSEITNLLLEKGFDINAKNHAGETALHIAALNGDKKMIVILGKYNPELDATNMLGETPYFLAARAHQQALIKDPDLEDSNYRYVADQLEAMGADEKIPTVFGELANEQPAKTRLAELAEERGHETGPSEIYSYHTGSSVENRASRRSSSVSASSLSSDDSGSSRFVDPAVRLMLALGAEARKTSTDSISTADVLKGIGFGSNRKKSMGSNFSSLGAESDVETYASVDSLTSVSKDPTSSISSFSFSLTDTSWETSSTMSPPPSYGTVVGPYDPLLEQAAQACNLRIVERLLQRGARMPATELKSLLENRMTIDEISETVQEKDYTHLFREMGQAAFEEVAEAESPPPRTSM